MLTLIPSSELTKSEEAVELESDKASSSDDDEEEVVLGQTDDEDVVDGGSLPNTLVAISEAVDAALVDDAALVTPKAGTWA